MSLRRTSKDLNFLPSSSFFFETKSWQKHQFLSDSNKLGNFNNTNKEFLLKKSSPQKNPPEKSSQKIFPKKSFQKILLKNSAEKNSKKNPKNTPLKFWKNPKNFQSISQKVPNFENIQFPTSHLEAENPFGLVLIAYYNL